MKTKYKVMLMLILLSLCALFYVAQSYKLWGYEQVQNNSDLLSSGCFSVGYQTGQTTTINNDDFLSDEQALEKVKISFNVTNSCSKATSYDITLNALNNSSDNSLKYFLDNKNAERPSEYPYLKDSSLNTNFEELSDLTVYTSYYLLQNETLQSGNKTTYDLYLWSDSELTSDYVANLSVINIKMN